MYVQFDEEIEWDYFGISAPSLRLANFRRASNVGPPPNSTVVIFSIGEEKNENCTVCLINHFDSILSTITSQRPLFGFSSNTSMHLKSFRKSNSIFWF